MASQDTEHRADTLAAPPLIWFGVSAVFHYLGPAFAVLLFSAVGTTGVVWLRVTFAAALFALVTKPIQTLKSVRREDRLRLISLGLCFAVMNSSFYFALERLPMTLVAAMEFIGTVVLALVGLRSVTNFLGVSAVVVGVSLLVDHRWSTDLVGLGWAALNTILFTTYIVIGHRLAKSGAVNGIQQIGVAMLIASIVLTAAGLAPPVATWFSAEFLAAGLGIAVCSSVIPYACDQLVMAK